MNLERFPRRTLRGDLKIHRIHRAARDPWWFSNDGSGRFDPVDTVHGACYFAEQPLGAWVEVFRKRMLLAEADVQARALQSVETGRDLRLADLTSRRALGYGITASLGANERYDASQAFAVAALEAGFDGIRYLVRHDPAQKLYGIALFGPAGAPDPADGPDTTDADRPAGNDGQIPADVVADAVRLFGYRVLPVP